MPSSATFHSHTPASPSSGNASAGAFIIKVVTVSRLIRTRRPGDATRRSGRRRRAALSFLGLRRAAMPRR
ncbi:hypothetical protein AB0F17_35450 [Nonomuraea sp. NPDC026600]|uniref:hypothetical protein n=1 Tax=Nonomuraea sp. NPDC026600 TaxID=3155363 RepID=UPI00340569F5